MGWVHLLACCLVAYSVPGVLFVATTATRPQLLVICLLAGFAWLLTFLLTSFLWSLFAFMQEDPWSLVIIGAAFQEAARIVFLKAYIATARSFSVVGLHALLYPLTDIYAALATGLGFALTHITVIHASIFFYSLEYGALFSADPATCPPFSLFTSTALTALLTGLLHPLLTVLQLDAVRRGKRRRMTSAVVLGMMAAIATVLSGVLSWGCVVSLVLLLCVVVAAGMLALLTVQQDDYASRKRV